MFGHLSVDDASTSGRPPEGSRSIQSEADEDASSQRIDVLKICFLAVLAVWVLVPVAATAGIAQDAVPYLVAGRILETHPSQVYASQSGDVHDLQPLYKREYCDLAQLREPICTERAVAYVATPLALPMAFLLRDVSAKSASFIMRFGAAVMLAGGMWLLYRRLERRTRWARAQLLVTVLALTPMAIIPIGFAQTSPLLFLSVCLGLSGRTRGRRILSPLVWVGAAAFKLFPAALVLVLVWLRRRRFLFVAGAAAIVLAVITLIIAPWEVVSGFVNNSLHFSSTAENALQQSSVSAFIRSYIGTSTWAKATSLSVGVIAAGALSWFGFRQEDLDLRWAAAYLALLLLSPVVWWHYLWVSVGALALALSAQRHLTDRLLMILPLTAAATLPPSWFTGPSDGSMPHYQALFLIGTAVVTAALAYRCRGPADTEKTCLQSGEAIG